MLEWDSTGSPLISAVAPKIILTLLWLSKFQFYSPPSLHLHGDYPHQAFPADSIKTHQTAYLLASFLHISEQFLERSFIFYSHNPPNPPPLHPLMHTFSPAYKCQAQSAAQAVLECLNMSHEKLKRGRLTAHRAE